MGSTVADVIATALARHGVEIIFGQSNPSALMLAAEDIGIRQILFRTENAGGVMADGYARVTNRISIIAVQNGPAATLAVAPMAEAIKASIPMLVLVQDVPTTLRDRNAFQDFDHHALFAGVSKWTRSIDDPARADDFLDMAMMAANTGRPGPVVLLLPRNVLDMEAVPPRFARTSNLGRFPIDRPRPAAAAVARAAELLAAADAPVVIAGGGVHVSDAVEQLAALIETAHLPVATTNMGKGAVDENGPMSLGVAANITGRTGPAFHVRDLINDADVVLMIGSRTNENGTDGWTLTRPDATYIHVDVDPIEVGRTYDGLRLVGDARSALEDLTAALDTVDLSKRRAARPALERRIAESRRLRARELHDMPRRLREPISPQQLMGELDALLAPDDIVAADASLSTLWVTGFLTARKAGQRFITPRGIAGLGWGLPYAMGVKLAQPAARVFTLVGDGGFAHVWSELETAMRENIPVITIVLNNGELSYQRLGEQLTFGRTTTGIAFAPVDHAAVARSVGALGIRVEKAADIRGALDQAIAANVSAVVDVIVDPDALPPLPVLSKAIEARCAA